MGSRPASTEITPDEGFDDEGFAESVNTSYVTSIASEIRRGVEENGRTYPAYGKNAYGLPIDEAEQDRNDLQHCKFLLLLGGKLHLAPIVEAPQRILDLGTGTGIWAIDMADKFPTAQVIGVDLAAVQPSWVPPNIQFEIDDVEDEWAYGRNKFDFIHARNLLLAIRNWDRLVQKSFSHLNPGGYLEVSGTWLHPSSDDNTIPEDSAYAEFFRVMRRIGDEIDAPVDAPLTWKSRMQNAGFEDVQECIFKVPTSPWPKDPRLKKVGAFDLVNFEEGARGFMMRGFTQILGGSKDEAEVLIARARSEARNRHMHSFVFV
jgi:SAM-dependent methyltransferase